MPPLPPVPGPPGLARPPGPGAGPPPGPPGLGPLGPLAPPGLATPPSLGVPEGVRAQARVKLGNAVRELTEIIGLLKEISSDEAKAVLTALKALAPVTPDVDEGVSKSQLRTLLGSAQAVRPNLGGPPGMPGGGLGPLPPRPSPF